MTRAARISPELIHDILAHLVPSWDWGSTFHTWKEIRELKPARAHAFWFLNLRLANRNLNTIVLDLFVDVVANDSNNPGALTDDPETGSMMAMGRRILRHLVSSFAGDHCSGKTTRRANGKSPYRLVNMIIQIGERAAALFSDPRLENDEDLREAYTKGAIATLIGLAGTQLLVFLDHRYQAKIEEFDHGGVDDTASAVLMDINFHCFKKQIWPPLMAACLAGRLDLVDFLLEKGADLHIRPDLHGFGATIGTMEIAARAGHAHIVDFLIQNNVSATGADTIGYGNILDELLKRKDLDANATDVIDEVRDATAVAVAAGLGREKIFRTLFDHPGVDRVQPTVPKAAVEGGNLNIPKRIVEEVPGCLEKCRKGLPGETALCKAAEDGTEEAVRYLLTVDEQPIRRGDMYRRTPLHRAIHSGAMDQECFAMADKRESTYLPHAAESHRNPHILQALLNRPVPNINARNSFGQTPIAAATWHGAVGMFKALLAREDVMKDSLDNFGQTPFMNTAVGGAEEIIDIFFQQSLPGTEVWRRDRDNRTALQLAVQNDRDNAVKRLLDPDIGATEEIIRDALRDAETRFARWIEEMKSTRDSPEEWEDWCLEMRKKKKDIIKILSGALEHGLQ
ncbi:ankyrin repeat-containing domain protein [Aspergillus ambiguus]|uniref:ankyrin repeat-containing domain protein n=1 Tax=Aspergillus ambiguus TaxID=176160 RepID=UPI003CCE008C